MLIVNPYFLVYDVGFLLSYSALIGLIYFDTLRNEKAEKIKTKTMKDEKDKKKNKKNYLLKGLQYVYKNYISPSVGASLGIFPVIIFFMGKMNFMGIIGNLFVLPIVPFVMIYGFVSTYVYSRLHWDWLLWIEKLLVVYIYKVAEVLTKWGVFVVVTGLWLKYLFLFCFLLLFVVWRYKASKLDKKDE
jgi:predicted membrane metal-binding protein